MERQKRHTKKYSFRQPDLKELRNLTSYVLDPLGFKARFGKLLPLLTTQVDEGLMGTLVQFYDPLYHCFSFLDFQLLPTLEEYAYLVGIPILDQVPFSGLESIPTSQEIADLLHIDESLIRAHMTAKGGIQGLPSEFLIAQATVYGKAMSEDAFEAIFVLLIYGLVLFPNIDKFVDVNAIRIFSALNPVPTLLGDTYFSLHLRNAKGGGAIVCCLPLLYKWFISHLPQTLAFKENKGCLRWSTRLMSLTNDDISWYNRVYDGVQIIDSCGEFSNVPLLGTCGGISYNPVLARRQLRFPLKDKPNNILLEGVFFQEGKDPQGLKGRMVRAWRKIHKKGRNELGPKNCIALEPYTAWVRKRASEYLMPYDYPRPTPLVVAGPSTLPNQGVIDDPDDAWTSLLPQSSKFWKRRYDRLAKEKADMEAAYEREVKKLRATYLPACCSQPLVLWSNSVLFIYFEDKLTHRHLSSFSNIDAEDEVGTPFQALSIAKPVEKRTPSFASYRDAKLAIECGAVAGLGKMIELEDNKSRVGIGFSFGVFNEKGLFKSGGFIHTVQSEEAAAILEEDAEDSDNFVIPGGICNNWVAVDIPTIIHKSKLISKPIEHNDPAPSPNFEFPVFEAEEDDVEGIPDEITHLLEHEKKISQLHLEKP
ncbi:hypothetical protein KIW84_076336 [Lathyrus oleraceus]|uniref:DUF7745 domain-containing protein n=1 Tax=Pisum sativum TaxID=3888 RepID=A0A9D4ZZA9_PEA|nr:hypothetical protein KIW84_076336 [Pisum sativum]